MVRNNNIPENWIPEPPAPKEEGGVLGSQRIENENILRNKAEVRESSAASLDALKSKIDHQKDSLDTLFAPKTNHDTPIKTSNWKRERMASSFTPILTRRPGDVWKGPIHAVFDSAIVFWWLILDVWKDAVAIMLHPIDTTKGTIVSLEEESTAKII